MAPNQPLRKADFLVALAALAIIAALIAAPRVVVFSSAGVSLVLACGTRFYRATHPSAWLTKLELALWIAVIVVAIYVIAILPYNMAVLSSGLVAILSFFSYRTWHTASRSHPVAASFVDLLIWTTGVGVLLTIVAISMFLESL